jgi:hypothetical protein
MTLNLYDQDNHCLRHVSYAFEEGFIHILSESQYVIVMSFEEKEKV